MQEENKAENEATEVDVSTPVGEVVVCCRSVTFRDGRPGIPEGAWLRRDDPIVVAFPEAFDPLRTFDD